MVEGCITQPGTRRLLRFDTATANVGTADLFVGVPTAGVCFQFSECHQHYHFLGFSQYTLYQTDGTTVAATGHKQSFCLEDVEQYQAAPAPDPATPFSCTNQGLHVGWEDVYPNDIDCQWVDITGVPAGNYLLKVAVNTAGYLPESDYPRTTPRPFRSRSRPSEPSEPGDAEEHSAAVTPVTIACRLAGRESRG